MALNAAEAEQRRQRTAEVVNLRFWYARHLLEGADEDLAAAEQAYEVLGLALRDSRPDRRGRPPGGTYTRGELLGIVAEQAAAIWRGGTRPTLAAVAQAIGWSPDGLGRALRRAGIDWRLVRADAERRAR